MESVTVFLDENGNRNSHRVIDLWSQLFAFHCCPLFPLYPERQCTAIHTFMTLWFLLFFPGHLKLGRPYSTFFPCVNLKGIVGRVSPSTTLRTGPA